MWIMGIANVEERKLLYMTVIEEEPAPAAVWREILSAFRQPMDRRTPPAGEAGSAAGRVLCRRGSPSLAEIEVACVFEDDPQPIGQLLGGNGRTGQTPAVTATAVRCRSERVSTDG